MDNSRLHGCCSSLSKIASHRRAYLSVFALLVPVHAPADSMEASAHRHRHYHHHHRTHAFIPFVLRVDLPRTSTNSSAPHIQIPLLAAPQALLVATNDTQIALCQPMPKVHTASISVNPRHARHAPSLASPVLVQDHIASDAAYCIYIFQSNIAAHVFRRNHASGSQHLVYDFRIPQSHLQFSQHLPL